MADNQLPGRFARGWKLLSRASWDHFVNRVCASPLILNRFRSKLLSYAGVSCKFATISADVFFGGSDVTIGERSFINRGVFFDPSAGISIAEDVAVGMNVQFVTSSHEIGNENRRAGSQFAQRISVDRGAWIGAGAILCPGSRVGRGVVIAAGSLVRGDCTPNSLYAGVPAKLIRELGD